MKGNPGNFSNTFSSTHFRSTQSDTARSTIASVRRKSDLLQAFNVLDADRDNKISKDNLRRTSSSSSSLSTSDDNDRLIDTMISHADSDNDGYVQFHEFQQVLNKGQRKSQNNVGGLISGVMEEAFKVMDRDGDGRLGVDDLREFLGMGGVVVSDKEAREMMRLGEAKGEEEGVDIETLVRILGI
ncbi:hypothetical protein Drorol1_Dr00012181 [Drosera rotundifolia]